MTTIPSTQGTISLANTATPAVDPQITAEWESTQIPDSQGFELVPASAHSFGAFADQVPSTNSSQQGSPKKKRKYQKEDEQFTDDVQLCLQQFLLSSQALYLVDLNKDRQDVIQEYHFGKIPEGQAKDYLMSVSRKRFYGNSNTWKCRTLKDFRKYIKALDAKDRVFHNTRDKHRCEDYLQDRFSLDDFVIVFSWVKSGLVLKGNTKSDRRVQRWCKIIWVDLGACLKMALNQDNGTMRTDAADTNVYDEDFISARWDQYGSLQDYKPYRPKLADVRVDPNYLKKKCAQDIKRDKDGHLERARKKLFIPVDDLPGDEEEDAGVSVVGSNM